MKNTHLRDVRSYLVPLAAAAIFGALGSSPAAAQSDCHERIPHGIRFPLSAADLLRILWLHGAMLPSIPCDNHGPYGWCFDQHELESLNTSPLAVSLDGTLLSLVPRDLRVALVEPLSPQSNTINTHIRSCTGEILVRRLSGVAQKEARVASAKLTL
jgi:hypothetical protein